MIDNFWNWFTNVIYNILGWFDTAINNTTISPFIELFIVVFLICCLIKFIIKPLTGSFSGSDRAIKRKDDV